MQRHLIEQCVSRNKDMYKYLYSGMFDKLGFLKRPFVSWIRGCSLECPISLKSIGRSKRNHKQSKCWKHDIKSKSVRRLNITKELDIHDYYLPIADSCDYDFTNESRLAMIKDRENIFKHLMDLGFEINIYQQKQKRRGISIVVTDLYQEIENDNFETNIFIVNPNVPDGKDYVSSEED